MLEDEGVEELKKEGDEFHSRLLEGDITVTAEIANAYLVALVEILSKKFPQLDNPHLIPTAVEDALLNYFDRPEQFNPQKGISLFAYLRMSANGDLLNLLAQHETDISNLNYEDFVELPLSESEYRVEPDNAPDVLVERLDSSILEQLADLFPDAADQEVVGLLLEGERKTHAFAKVLGILDLPVAEQRVIVKRQKDRIKKTIQRHIKPSDLSNG